MSCTWCVIGGLSHRTLDHQNLCKFIGATIKDPLPNMAIISEYCPKGSLNDVLQNDSIPLNWNFRFAFAEDIARGMAFLHSRSIIHGRLTSSNCVIDDRWVTKVTGDITLPMTSGKASHSHFSTCRFRSV